MQIQFSPANLTAELNCMICTRPIPLSLDGALANVPQLIKPMIQTWQRGTPNISIQNDQIGGVACVVCKGLCISAIDDLKRRQAERRNRIKRKGKGVNQNGR